MQVVLCTWGEKSQLLHLKTKTAFKQLVICLQVSVFLNINLPFNSQIFWTQDKTI